MGKLRFCKDYSILSKTSTKDMYGRENIVFVENGSIKGYLYNSVSYRDIQAYGDLAKSTYKIMSEEKAEIYSNGNNITSYPSVAIILCSGCIYYSTSNNGVLDNQ